MVTGEGVAVELPIAGVPSRAASGIIDVLVAGVLLFALQLDRGGRGVLGNVPRRSAGPS